MEVAKRTKESALKKRGLPFDHATTRGGSHLAQQGFYPPRQMPLRRSYLVELKCWPLSIAGFFGLCGTLTFTTPEALPSMSEAVNET